MVCLISKSGTIVLDHDEAPLFIRVHDEEDDSKSLATVFLSVLATGKRG